MTVRDEFGFPITSAVTVSDLPPPSPDRGTAWYDTGASTLKVWNGASWASISGGGGSLPPGGSTGEVLTKQSGADGDADWQVVAGTGDVVGPASSTDNAVARFNLATGKLIQNSAVTIDDSGNIATSGTVDGRDLSVDGAKLDGIAPGAVSDHGNLAGLADDDHTQYAKNTTGHSAAGFVTTTGATSRDLQQSPVAVDVGGNLSTIGDIATSGGNILVFGTVDGRDVAADGAKLDGIEAGADVTDAANVDAAGAVMVSDLGSGSGFQAYAFGTWTAGRTIQGGTGIDVTNGNGIAGSPSVAVDGTVLVDSDFGSDGMMVRSGAGAYVVRTLAAGDGIVVANGDGTIGNPSVSVDLSAAASMEFSSGDLQLEGDSASPGKEKYYGTDATETKGWHALPTGGGGAAIFPIWAEENATLAANQYEWAFGNGANMPNGMGVVVPFACELFAVSLCLAAGSASVRVQHNGSDVHTITSSGLLSYDTLGSPVAVSAGDVVGFQTATASGTGTPNVICAWYRTT
jgi:hypothetical protein